MYERWIGLIPNRATAERITALADAYSLDEFEAACQRANKNGAASLPYVEAVLRQSSKPAGAPQSSPYVEYADEWQLLQAFGFEAGPAVTEILKLPRDYVRAWALESQRRVRDGAWPAEWRVARCVNQIKARTAAPAAMIGLARLGADDWRNLVMLARAVHTLSVKEHISHNPTEFLYLLPEHLRTHWRAFTDAMTTGHGASPATHYALSNEAAAEQLAPGSTTDSIKNWVEVREAAQLPEAA